MKKILSTTLALLLVLTTVFSVSLSAQAAVRYDSDNAALYSGSGYTWLNIRGTENYKSAFQFMDILNTERTANAAGTLAMDQELLEAAMLHAREISVYPSSNRPNGENAIYLLDGTGHTRFYLLQVSAASSDAKLIFKCVV